MFSSVLKFNPHHEPAGSSKGGQFAKKPQAAPTSSRNVTPLNPRGLPMDPASRLARARAMGFDTDHVWYHGTFSDFTEFQRRFSNPSAYFGDGIYFSDSPTDVNMNYVNPESPDWTDKAYQRIEELVNELEMERPEEDPHVLRIEAEELVTEEISKTKAIVLKTFLKMERPLDLTDDTLLWGITEKQDEEGEYTGEVSGDGVDLLDSLDATMLGQYMSESSARDYAEFKSNLQMRLLEDGGITPKELLDEFKSSEVFSYLEDDNGELMGPGTVFREVMRYMGYDGIIMDASKTFPTLVSEPNVRHAIVFDPRQVRSVFAVFDPEQKNSSDIRKADFYRALKFNPHHEPAGSSKGGQFAKKPKEWSLDDIYDPPNRDYYHEASQTEEGKRLQANLDAAIAVLESKRKELREAVIAKIKSSSWYEETFGRDTKSFDTLVEILVTNEREQGALVSEGNAVDAAWKANHDFLRAYAEENSPPLPPYYNQARQLRPEFTETEAFKKWFSGSKVVDAEGRPLVAFHGTNQDITSFITGRNKSAAARLKQNPYYTGELGAFFSAPSLLQGEYDAGNAEATAEVFSEARGDSGAVVYPVFLSIKNPKEYEDFLDLLDDRDEAGGAKELRQRLMKEGFDGLVVRNSMTDGNMDRDDWVAFSPTQIKSAMGNSGGFDPNDPSIVKADFSSVLKYSPSQPREPKGSPVGGRFARALQQGYAKETYYHGIPKEIPADFEFPDVTTSGGHRNLTGWVGTWFTENPKVANSFTTKYIEDKHSAIGSSVLPVKLRLGKAKVYEGPTLKELKAQKAKSDAEQETPEWRNTFRLGPEQKKYREMLAQDPYEQFLDDMDEFTRFIDESPTTPKTKGRWRRRMMLMNDEEAGKAFRAKLIAEGYDSIIIRGTRYDSPRKGTVVNQVAVLDPANIRSVHAEFDPKKVGLIGIMKFNPNHEPAGSPKGGQFARTPGETYGTGNDAGRDTGPAPSNGGSGRGDEKVVPHYGRAREGAKSFRGVHYSGASRQTLDSAFYGNGIRGREAARLLGIDVDSRLKKRVYFYVDEGNGIRPEPGVGSHRHEVDLDNIYDPKSDGGALWRSKGPNPNDAELAVIEAGFDGYYSAHIFGKHGAIVLIGDHNVPVVETPPPVRKAYLRALKFNPNHDPATGRFTSSGGVGTSLHEGEPLRLSGSMASGGRRKARASIYDTPHKTSKEKDLKAFMEELISSTKPHPFDDRIRLTKDYVGIEARIWEGQIHLSSIINFQPKGKGLGTAALKDLIALADKHGVILSGTAKAIPDAGSKEGKSLTTSQLIKWYEKHGFQSYAGDLIERLPKVKKSDLLSVLKFNPNHEPAGSPKGGQFARKVTNTPQFKAWFRDSKVVDSNGEPLVVYHGTGADFDAFDPSTIGSHYGVDEGVGFYFAQRYEEADQAASDYANPQQKGPYADYDRWMKLETDFYGDDVDESKYEPYTGNGEVMLPVYLSIQNPLILTADRGLSASSWWDSIVKEDYVRQAKENGHDGIILRSDYHDYDARARLGWDRETGEVNQAIVDKYLPDIIAREEATRARDNIFIVFKPEQIKSATGNSGAFDPTDKRITKSFASVLKFNPNHEPAGSSKGGQFAKKPAGTPGKISSPDQLTLFDFQEKVEPDPQYTEDQFYEDLDFAESAKDVGVALARIGAEEVSFPGMKVWRVKNSIIEWDGKDQYPTVTDIKEWISTVDVEEVFPDSETDFNNQFWKDASYGGAVYHNTREENVRAILEDGIDARHDSWGLTNRWEGPGVYTTTEPEEYADGTYGDYQFEINIGDMVKDGYTPFVKLEPDVMEGQLRESIAYTLGVQDYVFDYQERETTIVFNGGIPAKYLTLMGDLPPEQEEVSKSSLASILKFNPNHEPAGTPRGGQFARSEGSRNDITAHDWQDGEERVLKIMTRYSEGKVIKVSVLKNPTQREVMRWAGREVRSIRLVVDDSGNYAVWDADKAIHNDMAPQLHIIPVLQNSDFTVRPENFSSYLYNTINDAYSLEDVSRSQKEAVLRRLERATKWDKILKFNPNHEPAGSPKGGQFARGKGIAGNQIKEIPFYHGSPYKYDAVDLSHIGTGEGGQSYGWGYYGAQARETAEDYFNKFARTHIVGGKEWSEIPSDIREDISVVINDIMIHDAKNDPRLAAKILRHQVDMMGLPNIRESASYYRKAADMLERGEIIPHQQAQIYQGKYVWPDPAREAATPLALDDLLDWDKPLSEQPKILAKIVEADPEYAEKVKGLTGMELYYGNQDPHWTQTTSAGKEKADSEWLNRMGIPGIRYLDQMSRGVAGKGKWRVTWADGTSSLMDFKPDDEILKKAGATATQEGTYNIVMFDEKGIELLERNGIALKSESPLLRALKFNPHHEPAGSPKGGQFAKRPTGGADSVHSSSPPYVAKTRMTQKLLASGRYDLIKREENNRKITYIVRPKGGEKLQAIQGRRGTTWIDPELATGSYEPDMIPTDDGRMIDIGHVKTQLKEGWSQIIPAKEEKGVLYRGMSHEEYEVFLQTGEVKSKGEWNIGDELANATYYSTDPRVAAHYASGFAPVEFKAAVGKPAYVIAIKDPGVNVDPRQGTTDERAIPHAVPASEVVAVYEGRVYSIEDGEHEVVKDYAGGIEGDGGGAAPRILVAWKKKERVNDAP